jgi:HEAT repeat protein
LSRRPRAIPSLIAALADDEQDVRQNSANALGHFGEPALGPLIEALGDGDEEVRTWALCALGYMRDPRAVPHLLQAMVGDSAEAARQAARSLRMCGARAVEPLVDLLFDHFDPETRWNAAMALSGLGEPGITALVTAAGSDESATRMCAVAGLGEAANRFYFLELPDPRLAGSLHDALYDIDPAVRSIAAISLGRSGDAHAVDALAAMVRSDEPEARAIALEQLGRIEDPAAVDALVTALRDADADIRRAACEALGRLLHQPVSIKEAARDAVAGSMEPRTALIEVLTAWRDPSAAPPLIAGLRGATLPLIEALGDPESRVVDAAASALKRAAQPLTTPASVLPDDGTEGPYDGTEGTNDEMSRLRSLVRETLVPLSGLDAVAVLLAALGPLDDESDDRWEPLRAVIASLLGALADRRAVPALIELLRSSHREVVTRASAALGELGGPEAFGAILDRLTGPAGMPYDQMFSLMGDVLKLADDRTPALLLEAMRGAEWHVARDLAMMLNALGERALVPVVAALADAGPDMARYVAAALDPAESNYLIFSHDIRWRPAIEALDRLSDSDVDILVAAAGHDDEKVARVAVALLERLGHPAAVRTPEPEPESVERGVEDLADDDPAVRVEAAQSLGSRGVREALEPLTALLADEGIAVRGAVALALGQLGDRSVVDRLIPLLGDPAPPVIYRAAKALGMLGGADTLRVLLGSLDNDSVRAVAAEAIGEFGVEAYREIGLDPLAEALFAAMRHERRFEHDFDARMVYDSAQKVLTKLGEPARTMLLSALDDDHDAVRHLAAEILGEGADLRALPVLGWMEENDRGEYVSGGGKPKHAARTARSLIQSAHRAREPLIESMTSGDRLTRFGAAFQLASLEWREATPVLVEALRDDDRRVRWGAARWLGELRDERAIEPLASMLGDPDEDVQDHVTRALVGFGPAAMPLVVAQLEGPDEDARAQAHIVGYCGDAGDVPRLIGALGDSAGLVSVAAARALGLLADREMIGDVDAGELGAALKSAFRAVEQQGRGGFTQSPIIDALEKFDRDGLVDVLIEALGSNQRDARMVAVKRLGRLGDRSAVAPLNQALSDDEWTVREDAVYALRAFADPSSVEPLIGVLSLGGAITSEAAIKVLAEIGDPRAAAPMVAQLRSQHDWLRAEAENTIVALADDAAIAALVALLGEDLPDWFAYHGDGARPA